MSNNVTFAKRKVLKKWVRIALLGIIITLFASSVYIISTSFNKNNDEDIFYSYNIKQDLDYTVSLYDNSFIESSVLGKDEMYISDLIKQINMNYKYNYAGSKIVPLTYTYNVIASINGEYQLDQEKEDSKVWTKKYTLVDDTTKEVNDTTAINIDEPIKIDFKFYNDVVSKFRQELKLPITASLNVVFSINVTGEENNQKINDTKEIKLSIPLNQQAFKMTETYEAKYNNNLSPKTEKKEAVSIRKLMAGIILMGSALFMFILLFRDIFNLPKKNAYTIKLNKILKNYGDVIIEIVTPVNEDNLNVVEVKNFNEIMDLEEELRVPIMFYETIDYEEGEFSLVHGDIIYRFVLKNE